MAQERRDVIGKRGTGRYASSRKLVTIHIWERKIHLIWVLRSRQDLTPGGGSTRESAQRWDDAWALGSSQRKCFVVAASLLVYFWWELLLGSSLGSGNVSKTLKVHWRRGWENKGRGSRIRWGAWGREEERTLQRKKVRPSQGGDMRRRSRSSGALGSPYRMAYVSSTTGRHLLSQKSQGVETETTMKVRTLWRNGWRKGRAEVRYAHCRAFAGARLKSESCTSSGARENGNFL